MSRDTRVPSIAAALNDDGGVSETDTGDIAHRATVATPLGRLRCALRRLAGRVTYRDLALVGVGAAAARVVDELGAADGGLWVASVAAVFVAARTLTVLRERHG